MKNHPPTWKHQFASDNASAICPAVWDALAAANGDAGASFAIGYGDDDVTAEAIGMIQALFETDCDVFFVYGGTAANALALSALCTSYHGLISHRSAHAICDETNSPEFFTGGMKIVAVDGDAGKIDPALLPAILDNGNRIHSAKMRAITLTQSTEAGTVYTVDEVRAITKLKAAYADLDLKFHMDGARFANAMAAHPDVTPKEITWQSGIDVLTFGATKNGAPASEAIIFFDRELARDFQWRRKQAGQLASKMRYLAAPWLGLLSNDVWRTNAAHANRQAAKLATGLDALPGVQVCFPAEANMVFTNLPESLALGLKQRGWAFKYDPWFNATRFMCSWGTTDEAVEAILADARELHDG